MTSRRASVTETPAMTMSLWPFWAEIRAASKLMSSTTSSRPSMAAMAEAISTSMPSKPPSSVVISYGGKEALVDMWSLPASTVVTVGMGAAVTVTSLEVLGASVAGADTSLPEAALPLLPQAAKLSASSSARARMINFFIARYSS